MTNSDIHGSWQLDGYSILRISGPDAVAFLHGQLTNSVQGMGDQLARPGAYCTAQGRLYANGFFWLESAGPAGRENAADSILFLVAADLAESLLRRLSIFVLRSKVRLEIADGLYVSGHIGADHMPDGLHQLPAWSRISVDEAYWVVAPAAPGWPQQAAWRIAGKPLAAQAESTDGKQAATACGTAWSAYRLAGGWPMIQAGTQDKFLPSTLNMDLNGSIDFKKGCYPGQEVIARSHYRGSVKRRMAYGTTALQAGSAAESYQLADLYPASQENSRPVGRLIEHAIYRDKLHAAAEINLGDWPDMQYALGAPDGPVLDLDLCA